MKKVNSKDIRTNNRNQIFRYINLHPTVSRPEIAAALCISAPTVLMLTEELLQKGVIEETGSLESTGGRKAIAVKSIYDYRYAIGLDITANHISLVITNISENIIFHKRIGKPFENSDSYFKETSEILMRFIKDNGISDDKILGLGISIPGIVDVAHGVIPRSKALNVANVPFESISAYFSYKCNFINDANAAAFAESLSRTDNSYVVFFSLSNTVGGAIITPPVETPLYTDNGTNILNQCFCGDNWRGGEIGHVTLFPEGKQCYCGKKGCFDAYCSAKVLSSNTNGNLDEFMIRLKAGDERFIRIWDEYLDNLCIMVNNIHTIFDCKIILGGYVGGYLADYLDAIYEKLQRRYWFNTKIDFVEICKYNVESSAFGASLIVMEEFLKSI